MISSSPDFAVDGSFLRNAPAVRSVFLSVATSPPSVCGCGSFAAKNASATRILIAFMNLETFSGTFTPLRLIRPGTTLSSPDGRSASIIPAKSLSRSAFSAATMTPSVRIPHMLIKCSAHAARCCSAEFGISPPAISVCFS